MDGTLESVQNCLIFPTRETRWFWKLLDIFFTQNSNPNKIMNCNRPNYFTAHNQKRIIGSTPTSPLNDTSEIYGLSLNNRGIGTGEAASQWKKKESREIGIDDKHH